MQPLGQFTLGKGACALRFVVTGERLCKGLGKLCLLWTTSV